MKTYKPFAIVTVLLGILGCSKTYKLNSDDLKRNPYNGGEILIFQNNHGMTDTIFIKSVNRTKTVDDNLSVFPNYHESLDVMVKHSDPTPPNEQRYLESSFFNLYATNDKNTIFTFSLAAKNSWFYADTYYKNDLDKLSVQKFTGKNFVYEDVIKLEPQRMEYFERNEFVTAVYWSKSKGYVGYDLKNGVHWELVAYVSK